MALVHRSDELIPESQRISDDLNGIVRGERSRADIILRYSCGKRNEFESIPDGPTGNSVETDELLEELEYEKRKA